MQLNSQLQTLNAIEITDVENEDILESLKLSKAAGQDKLESSVLKQ